jgi:hypothetical protein
MILIGLLWVPFKWNEYITPIFPIRKYLILKRQILFTAIPFVIQQSVLGRVQSVENQLKKMALYYTNTMPFFLIDLSTAFNPAQKPILESRAVYRIKMNFYLFYPQKSEKMFYKEIT